MVVSPKQEQALAKLQGTHADAAQITKMLDYASKNFNLIAPATACGQLPPGFEVALTVVPFDAREVRDGGETYGTGGGKYGLTKSVLDRIAVAAGVSWDASASGRTDDGTDPHYVAYRAVGVVKGFDGSPQVKTGEKQMDLREGSAQLQSMLARSKGKDITNQLREMRLFILEHAESKAKNRAIRSLGLKSGFTKEDLAKPFVCAKLMFSGRCPGDPELERQFAVMHAERFLGATQALYGVPSTPRAQAQARALPAPQPPPPVGTVGPDDDDVFAPTAPPPQMSAPPPQQRQQQAPPPPPANIPPGEPTGFTIPGGREKGTDLIEASDGALTYWAKRISDNLAAGDSRYEQKDTLLLEAMRAEQARRSGGADEPPPGALATDDDDDDIPF